MGSEKKKEQRKMTRGRNEETLANKNTPKDPHDFVVAAFSLISSVSEQQQQQHIQQQKSFCDGEAEKSELSILTSSKLNQFIKKEMEKKEMTALKTTKNNVES